MLGLGLLVLRIVIGLIVAAHGAQKLLGWWGGPGMANWTNAMTRMRIRPAAPWAWLSALAELLGGLGLALGFLSPLPSFGIIASMVVAIALAHWPNGFWNAKRGYEFNLSLVAAALAAALTGPGPYSLDSWLGIHLPEPITFIVVGIATLVGVGVALGTRSKPVVEAKTEPA
ncbi:MAG: DoxX family protein [Candidatus Dormibacteraceae bacterium]